MARLLLGQHPHGPVGLFISKPGVAVENVSPNDTINLIFSSAWGRVASVIAAGTTNINKDIYLPAVGFRPYVHVEDQVGSSYNYGLPVGLNQQPGGAGEIRRYDWTRYTAVYLSDTVCQIRPRQPSIDAGEAGQLFRYLVLNFPVYG